MKPAGRLLCVLVILASSACGGLGSVPRDRYYRLPPGPAASAAAAHAPAVVVPPFVAAGVYADRALVFAHADGVTLEQYHYHLWVDSPRVLLRERLAGLLGARLGARAVPDLLPDAPLVRGHVRRLERARHEAGPDTAEVALRFEYYAAGERVPRLARDYSRSSTLASDDMSACVAALGEGIDDILAEWVTDLGQAWQP